MNTDLGRGVRQRRHPAQRRVGGAEEQPALRGVEGGVADDVVLCVFVCFGVWVWGRGKALVCVLARLENPCAMLCHISTPAIRRRTCITTSSSPANANDDGDDDDPWP